MKLRIWTIVLNFLVLVGRGHGLATVGIFGFFGFTQIVSGEYTFIVDGSYEYRLETVGVISLAGEILLLTGYWMNGKGRVISTLFGCITMLIATMILVRGAYFMNSEMISLLCSVPYLLTSILLIRSEIKVLKSA